MARFFAEFNECSRPCRLPANQSLRYLQRQMIVQVIRHQ